MLASASTLSKVAPGTRSHPQPVSTNPPLAVVRLHASLNVSDMVRAVAFYRELLGCPPAKQRPDYAKFEIDEPPLVLSLIPGHVAGGGPLNHLGLRVRSPDRKSVV